MMPSEQWQEVQDLFHAALERGPGNRSIFLDQACGGNESLRREVAWLISAHETEEHFIDAPAYVSACDVLAGHHYEPGEMLGHYRFQAALGSGGMGEVYLAEDIRLNRKVALKLLPPHFTVNPDRVRRFEREARAASALNHPNIVTIYEIGQSDTTHFIATEFVDGKTLRQLLNEKPFTLNETLNVSMQVADALSGAHTAGIVHRDIKPENIMIRQDGYVKILDFGLAKLTEQQTGGADLETSTLLQSIPGLVMGTVHYMSPEQARAKNVGVGTDIWSLGIVIYELLAGNVPFTGETPSHVMVSLMEDKLPPLTERANVPHELDQFVTKALQKNKKERYQTAGQLARDLKKLKQKLQQDSRLQKWLKTVPSRKEGVRMPPLAPLPALSGTDWVPLETRAAAETSPLRSHPTSSAEYFVREIKTHRTLALAASIVVVCSVIGLIYLFRIRTNSNTPSKSDSAILTLASPTSDRGTTSEEAYRHYLQGKNLTNQRSAEANKKAIENFEQAIRIDPNYARAYAGLAYVYHLGGAGGPKMEGVVWQIEQEKAKQAVKKALELDSNLAEAYAVRGAINIGYEWDFVAAEKDLTTAVQLEPNNEIAHWGHAYLCAYRGRFEQALKEIETAMTIAPGAVFYERERGKILYFARRYDEAIAQFARSLELKADSGSMWLSRAYEMKGDYSAAFEAFVKTQKDSQRIEAFRTAYETDGWRGVKWKFLEFAKLAEPKSGYVNSYQIAIAYAQLGEKEQALVYLNKLVAERSWQVSMLAVDPQVDSLRGDPRFEELLKRVRR
ncbi:MAG: protein kinase [Pyrinomonadaceae bacterium]|nr:protein kinase [Pyrinomonadaceae bacterium]